MAKMSKEDILNDEKRVLEYLKKKSGQSINKLAKEMNMSRQKLWRIIKRLENNNTIWGYTAITDLEKQNLKEFMCLVKRTNHPIDEGLRNKILKTDLTNIFPERVNVLDSKYTHGDYDGIISFTAKDIVMAKKFVGAFMEIYSEYFSETVLIEVLFPIRQNGIVNPEIHKFSELV
jgi:DNA-binding Lrp family transcriptional regulator